MQTHRLPLLRAAIVGSLCTLMASCGRADASGRTPADSARADSIARARQDSINRTMPGYVVDSIFPIDEEIRRFRSAIGGGRVAGLAHASSSREELIRRFVEALMERDSTELQAMLLTPHEFLDLVYPSSPYPKPPYRESPARIWMLIDNPSRSGLTRLLRRVAGTPMAYVDSRCDAKPDVQERNTIWTGCTVRVRESDGVIRTHRYFGSIIQRAGRFKFVSYANEL